MLLVCRLVLMQTHFEQTRIQKSLIGTGFFIIFYRANVREACLQYCTVLYRIDQRSSMHNVYKYQINMIVPIVYITLSV